MSIHGYCTGTIGFKTDTPETPNEMRFICQMQELGATVTRGLDGWRVAAEWSGTPMPLWLGEFLGTVAFHANRCDVTGVEGDLSVCNVDDYEVNLIEVRDSHVRWVYYDGRHPEDERHEADVGFSIGTEAPSRGVMMSER